jgi:hypothetical protein
MKRDFVSKAAGISAGLLFVLCGVASIAQTPSAISPGSGAIRPEVYRALYGEQGPAPGIYSIQSLDTVFCMSPRMLNGRLGYTTFGEPSYFGMHNCGDVLTQVAVLPHPLGGYTLRNANLEGDRRGYCGTVARGVVFGPARIDYLACDMPADSNSWGRAGGADQRYRFKRVSKDIYEIRTEQKDECLDVQGKSRDMGAAIIQWACTGASNQKFTLRLESPINSGREEVAQNLALGWAVGPDGPQRALPVRGVNMPAYDYVNYHTANDGGKECAARCVADTRCKAFTWAEPGYSSVPAMCWMKDRLSAPKFDGRTASGIVRE